MGRVDDGANALACEKPGQTFDAAEAANALRDRRSGRIGRGARKRQCRCDIGLFGDPAREPARFRRAAENEQTKAVQKAAP
jgi:hypothetical protein